MRNYPLTLSLLASQAVACSLKVLLQIIELKNKIKVFHFLISYYSVEKEMERILLKKSASTSIFHTEMVPKTVRTDILIASLRNKEKKKSLF